MHGVPPMVSWWHCFPMELMPTLDGLVGTTWYHQGHQHTNRPHQEIQHCWPVNIHLQAVHLGPGAACRVPLRIMEFSYETNGKAIGPIGWLEGTMAMDPAASRSSPGRGSRLRRQARCVSALGLRPGIPPQKDWGLPYNTSFTWVFCRKMMENVHILSWCWD